MDRFIAGLIAVILGVLAVRADGVNIPAPSWTYAITSLGTGVATALGINVGSAGAVVTNGGALGTPSSGTATNLSGTAASLTAGTVTTNANLTGDTTSVGNATTTTKINGVDQTTAWTAYTPTLSCGSGTLTSSSATGASKTLGKTVHVRMTLTVTTIGSCATTFNATLPTVPAATQVISGRAGAVSGKTVSGGISSGSSTFFIVNYDNTFPIASGEVIQIVGVYETQ